MKLPNQTNTWKSLGVDVEEFSDWQKRTNLKYGSPETEIGRYIHEQLKSASAAVAGLSFNDAFVGPVNYNGVGCDRIRELMLAYLAWAVMGDISFAMRIIEGQRLSRGLHEDYVKRTGITPV